jgi:hypothetical protein
MEHQMTVHSSASHSHFHQMKGGILTVAVLSCFGCGAQISNEPTDAGRVVESKDASVSVDAGPFDVVPLDAGRVDAGICTDQVDSYEPNDTETQARITESGGTDVRGGSSASACLGEADKDLFFLSTLRANSDVFSVEVERILPTTPGLLKIGLVTGVQSSKDVTVAAGTTGKAWIAVGPNTKRLVTVYGSAGSYRLSTRNSGQWVPPQPKMATPPDTERLIFSTFGQLEPQTDTRCDTVLPQQLRATRVKTLTAGTWKMSRSVFNPGGQMRYNISVETINTRQVIAQFTDTTPNELSFQVPLDADYSTLGKGHS